MLEKQDIEIIKELLRPLHDDIKVLKSDVGGLKSDVGVLKSDVGGLKSDVGVLKSDIGGLKSDIGGLKSDVGGLKSDVKELKTVQNKHSIQLEQINKKLNTLVEGQQAHSEQNTREFKDLKQDMEGDSTLVKSALKTVSGDVKSIKESTGILEEKIEELKGATAQNSYDVQVLKSGYKKRWQG